VLQRGEFAFRCREGAEAPGCNLTFKPGDFGRVAAGSLAPAIETRRLEAS